MPTSVFCSLIVTLIPYIPRAAAGRLGDEDRTHQEWMDTRIVKKSKQSTCSRSLDGFVDTPRPAPDPFRTHMTATILSEPATCAAMILMLHQTRGGCNYSEDPTLVCPGCGAAALCLVFLYCTFPVLNSYCKLRRFVSYVTVPICPMLVRCNQQELLQITGLRYVNVIVILRLYVGTKLSYEYRRYRQEGSVPPVTRHPPRAPRARGHDRGHDSPTR